MRKECVTAEASQGWNDFCYWKAEFIIGGLAPKYDRLISLSTHSHVSLPQPAINPISVIFDDSAECGR